MKPGEVRHPAQRWARFYKGLFLGFLIQGQMKHQNEKEILNKEEKNLISKKMQVEQEKTVKRDKSLS